MALLPGSRKGEIERLLPPMAELARRWRTARPEVQWVLPVAPTLDPAFVRAHLGPTQDPAPVTLVQDRSYAARAYADAALVASGTATLETALLGTPFAIVYKLNALTYQMARRIVKVPHFGLANVVARREVAPELLQGEVNGHRGIAGSYGLAEGAIGEDGGTESGVQDRSDPGSDERQTGIKIQNHGEFVAGNRKEGKEKRLDLGLLCRGLTCIKHLRLHVSFIHVAISPRARGI